MSDSTGGEVNPSLAQQSGAGAELPASPSMMGSNGTLSVSYEITAEHHVAALIRQHDLSVSRFRPWWWVATVVFVVIISINLAFTILAIIAGHGRLPPPPSWAFTMFLVGLGSFLLASSPWVRRRGVKRSLRLALQRHATEMLGPITLSIGPAGVTASRANREDSRRWQTVQRIEVVGHYALVFCGNLVMYSVPMSAFPTQGAFENFVSLARAYARRSEQSSSVTDLPMHNQQVPRRTSTLTWVVLVLICLIIVLGVLVVQLPPEIRHLK
ncbi:MAG: hypothetical protein ABR915_01505 [Thermoguttaceae bacterium]|jgi:hypothetical protein